MNASIFNAILQMSKQVSGSIATECSLLDKLQKVTPDNPASVIQDAINEAIDAVKINTTNGNVYEISKTLGLDIINIHDLRNDITTSLDVGDIEVNAKIFPNQTDSETFTSLLDSITKSETYNEAIYNTAQLFLSNPNNSSSDVYEAINSVQSGLNEDINTLKQQLINISEEGKISSYSYGSLLSQILTESKKSVDDSSLVASEDPFSIQSFIMTVMSITSTIVSVFIAALGALFSPLISVFNMVISGISNLLNNTFDTTMEFDIKKSYPGIKGTLYAGKYNGDMYPGMYWDYGAFRYQFGSEDCYFVRVNDHDKYLQTQPILQYMPDKLLSYLSGIINITISGTYTHFKSSGFKPWCDSNHPDIYCTTSDYIDMSTNDHFLENTIKINLIMIYLQRLKYFCEGSPDYDVIEGTIGTSTVAKKILTWVRGLFYDSTTLSAKIAYLHDDIAWADIRELYTWLRSLDNENEEIDHSSGAFSDALKYVFYENIFYAMSKSGFEIEDPNVIDKDIIVEVNSIPRDNMCQVPEYDVSTIVGAIAFIGLVLAGLILATKAVSAKFKAKKQIKKLQRTSNVNSLRQTYLENPTVENKQALNKALTAYNMKASIFGWNSYDAANGWFDATSDVSEQYLTTVVGNSEIINEIIAVHELIN